MVDALDDIREFLDRNPGEVVIMFIEPYVSPADIEEVFKEAGTSSDMAAVLDRSAAAADPRRARARRDKRVVVFTEHDADGDLPWYLDGFSFVQDTPARGDQARGPELQAQPRRRATARC